MFIIGACINRHMSDLLRLFFVSFKLSLFVFDSGLWLFSVSVLEAVVKFKLS